MAIDPITAALDIGKMTIARIWKDPEEAANQIFKLEQLAAAGKSEELQASVKLLIGQMEVNKTEAAHSSVFVAGWRPFVGWVGGASLAYAAIIEPLMRFIATLCGYDGEFPKIDTSVTTTVLMGMLGIGAMRSHDKRNKVDTKTVGK